MKLRYLGFLFLLAGCATAPPRMGERLAGPPVVKVNIASGDSVRIGGSEPFTITDGNKGKEVQGGEWRIYAGHPVLVILDEQGLNIKDPGLPVWAYAVSETGKVTVNGKPFRGTVEVRQDSLGKLVIINETDMESYLRGVVPSEIGNLDPSLLEAMKVQAIAARTYAWMKLKDPGGAGRAYDLESTELDQVYRGVRVETPTGDRAVRETHGQVVTFKGKPVPAYYCASCGGHTADLEESWEGAPRDYLKGFKDPYCRGAKNFSWERAFTRDQVQMMLDSFLTDSLPGGWKGNPGRWTSFRVVKRGPSGRVLKLLVTTDQGSYVLDKDRIRWAIADPATKAILPSTLFTVRINEDSVTFSGNGNGHGVGMCQVGAIEMARRGMSMKDILRFYYKGIGIGKMY
jgi:stage II sporulation protein D